MVFDKLVKTVSKTIVETKLCEMCKKWTGDNEHSVYGKFVGNSIVMGALCFCFLN